MKRKQYFSFQYALGICIVGFLIVGMFARISHSGEMKTSAASRGLNFNHGFHTVEAGMECAACHGASTSKTGKDDLLPGHDQCGDCHSVESECSKCHLSDNPELSPRIREFSPKFNHEIHVVTGKISCDVCHANLDDALLPEQVGHLPMMAECMACHKQKLVTNECAACHLPTDDLKPADHKLNWISLHGSTAAASQDACALCHNIAEDCQACHNGDAVSNPHPRNYISTHGPDAHLSDMTCAVCHDKRDYCNECHRSLNILPASHFRPGWLTASGGEHSDEAAFDLESCMSCHETPGQKPICTRCHGE